MDRREACKLIGVAITTPFVSLNQATTVAAAPQHPSFRLFGRIKNEDIVITIDNAIKVPLEEGLSFVYHYPHHVCYQKPVPNDLLNIPWYSFGLGEDGKPKFVTNLPFAIEIRSFFNSRKFYRPKDVDVSLPIYCQFVYEKKIIGINSAEVNGLFEINGFSVSYCADVKSPYRQAIVNYFDFKDKTVEE